MWQDIARIVLLVAIGVRFFAGVGWLLRAGTYHDFQTFHASGAAWLAGADPYLPLRRNMNPPAVVVAMSPFALLPVRDALFAWWIVGAAAALAAVRVIQKETSLSITLPLVIAALAFGGTWGQLVLGQIAWLLMLPATLGWRAYRRGDDVRAGAWWGVVLAGKPILLLLLVPFVQRKRYRAVAACLATGALVSLGGLVAAGFGAYLSWLKTGSGVDWFRLSFNASIVGVLSRFGVPRSVQTAIWLGLALLLVTATLRRRLDEDPDRDLLAWFCLSLLIAPLGWAYYLPLALGPLVAFSRTHRWPLAAVLGAFGLFWPPGVMWTVSPSLTVAQSIVGSLYAVGVLSLWWTSMVAHPRVPAPAREDALAA